MQTCRNAEEMDQVADSSMDTVIMTRHVQCCRRRTGAEIGLPASCTCRRCNIMLLRCGSRMWLLLVVVVALIASERASGQVLGPGGCPKQAVVQNFDVSKYLGTWYEYSNYFAFFQLGGRCVTATYTDKGNGRIGVFNNQKGIFGDKGIEGEAVLANPSSNEAKLTVSFSGPASIGGGSNYWVLDTDYDQYSIVWSCSDIRIANSQILWILTRKRFPDDAIVDKAMDIIKQRNLNVDKLETTDQQNC